MTNTVKHTIHLIGDRGGDFARSVGSGTVDLARRVGDGTATFVRDVGPRRAVIGLAIAAVAIGGSIFLIRYLRARRMQEDRRSGIDRGDDLTGGMGTRGDIGDLERSRGTTEFRNSY